MSDQTTGPMHLKTAKHAHGMLVDLETKIREVRELRDNAIRAAIAPKTPGHVTMYVAAKDLVMPQQTIARIRNRG